LNLVLLDAEDFAADGSVRLTGRRLEHVRTVLRLAAGTTLRVGRLHGKIGTAQVLDVSPDGLVLAPPTLTEEPPPRAALDLLLAVPRPKALRRVLPAVASLGVDRIVLLNAARVEKSYFAARLLAPARIDEQLRLGLEQAGDTVPPQVLLRPRFRPFVEDELDGFLGHETLRLLPHPGAEEPLAARSPAQRVALAVGPDGGWMPFEIALLRARGFRPVSLGPRTLRVEVAVAALIGALR
jgi:RsmE family RNA methyltransferase